MSSVGFAQRNDRAARDEISVQEISNRLAGQAAEVAKALLPAGRRDGQFWSCGGTHGDKGNSLKVNLTGARRGKWKDFATNEYGDLIDLIMATQGLDKGGAVQWAKRYLGIETERAQRSPEERRAWREQQEREAAERAQAAAEEEAADRAQRLASAIEIWRKCRKFPDAVTQADKYLRARGIIGPLPPTLRHHPRLWHGKTQRFLPALVAAVQGPDMLQDGQTRAPIIAVHRHWLDPQRPDVRKATDKFSLGPLKGGCVRLTGAAQRLILCEGVETGLSLKQSHTSAVWCALSVGNMVEAWIPDQVRELVIACDGDSVRRPAWYQARMAAVKRHERPGRVIRIMEPPEGMDFNDIAQLQTIGGLK